ncbi:c-type cytochrome [Oricola sp.]|uniref:cytochrome c n=1 Tax=Oricola sp. TaxID=1979950 RepID=UPI003BAD8156
MQPSLFQPASLGATGKRCRQGALWLAVAIGLVALQAAASATEAALTLTTGDDTRQFTVEQLLAHDALSEVTVPKVPGYETQMTLKAIPALTLFKGMRLSDFDTIEAQATDGYVSQLPTSLLEAANDGGSVAWIAVEPPDAPWPNLPDRDYSAGPLYLVWTNPEASDVSAAQWPYALASLTGVASPAQRWPQIAVVGDLAADAPERAGYASFVKNCLACHKIAGGGEAEIGPDLARPMSPTDYMTEDGLRKLIRDPASVRTWPDQAMTGFDEEDLSDRDIENIIAYLRHMAGRSR